jgi:uncharacterized protein YjbI with pentapeptide repeats
VGAVEVNGYTIEPGADLSGANLKGADLSGANLKGVDLTVLIGANLKPDVGGATLILESDSCRAGSRRW